MVDHPDPKPAVNWLALVPVAIFAALIGAFFGPGLFRENPDALPSEIAGGPAPAVAITALDDKPVFSDATLRDGQVKLVNFWASWCVPCRAEHPLLKELAAELPVYGVNYKDRPGNAMDFLTELGDPYAGIVADVDARMGIDWGLYGVPETFVVAGDGTVILRYAGPLTRAVIARHLRPAIAEAAAR